MLNKKIEFVELSNEIKKQIKLYYDEKYENSEVPFEDVMEIWFKEKFDSWVMENYCQNSELTDRKHFRLDVEIPIHIVDIIVESEDNSYITENFIGEIVNISRGGLYFKSDREIPVSTILKVVVDLESKLQGFLNIEALTMVVRVDELEDSFGIALMFSSIYEAHKENLDVYLIKYLSDNIYSKEE